VKEIPKKARYGYVTQDLSGSEARRAESPRAGFQFGLRQAGPTDERRSLTECDPDDSAFRKRPFDQRQLATFNAIGSLKIAKLNLPVAGLIWLMIVSMLLKIDFAALGRVA
jgi:hypothetical protein